jgi:lipid A 3-O-deacylase
LKQGLRLFLLLLAGTSIWGWAAARAAAQTAVSPDAQNQNQGTIPGGGLHAIPDSPVAEVRDQQSWEIAPFVNYGNGFGNRDQFKFFSAGVEFGKILSPVIHARFATGQFQFAGNIMPLWQAYTPPPHDQLYTCQDPSGNTVPCVLPTGGGTFRGVSLTPVILRWNLLTHSRRWQWWVQGAGGLIYTTHKFPPNILSNPALGIDGGTSVWNFSPQGGGGVHYFLRSKRSIDLGVNGVHISSASLGDRNPGVNASIQIQVGYTFWK